ncbi:endo-1,4-beta-xylanase [Terrimonas sp. NA20]|uniref:Beta-xylanase n=1 Tax=Terrimonas ginsenosidimutans TaxID=2908004 RepID=A0ABS9KPR1_9BACT|nr:endo-1,4-beta-xylanase [Terrimonas ginsenosidimutans]MCG2614290.1 endo-1,4-beta-xylanase [Terrimonas ginsenosidimutans]
MKQTYIKIGLILFLPAAFAACKKGPDSNIQDRGNFTENGTALRDVADFPIGTAINYQPLTNEPKFAEIVKRDFDAVTFGYEMKHGAIVQSNGTYNFTNADAMVAAVGPMEVFGHTLLWHQNQNATYLKNYAGITVPAATELATNPGFESGLTGWSVFNSGNPAGTSTITATSVTSEVRTGTGAMKVVNPTGYPGSQWRVQVSSGTFNTTVGAQYRIAYWVRAASAGGSIRLSTGGAGSAQYQGDQTIGTTWQEVSWTITANGATTSFLFDLGQAANTYFIDDASVKEVVVPPSGGAVAAKLETALTDWINALVGRYKGKVKAWDVVNEPFADNPVAIRNNSNTTAATDVLVWSNYLGRDFALKAFNLAKAADPTADLYINDYNLESNAAKLDSLIAYVKELKAKGAKVDGIGTQMHITRSTSYAGIEVMMQKLAATGLKIRISELDVRALMGSAAGKMTDDLLAFQAAMYKYVIASYIKHIPAPQRAGITIWGINDANSWLYDNGKEFPLLYDNDYNKKPAYAGVLQGLKGN